MLADESFAVMRISGWIAAKSQKAVVREMRAIHAMQVICSG
jgi:hypothetical protein